MFGILLSIRCFRTQSSIQSKSLFFLGDVYHFEHHSNSQRSIDNTLHPNQLNSIAKDISEALSGPANDYFEAATAGLGQTKSLRVRKKIKGNDIEDVYVFTWLRMKNDADVICFFYKFHFVYLPALMNWWKMCLSHISSNLICSVTKSPFSAHSADFFPMSQ